MTPTRQRRSRRRRILRLLGGSLLLLLAALWAWASFGRLMESLLESRLAQQLDAEVDVRRVEFSFWNGVTLRDLSIRQEGEELVRLAEVNLRFRGLPGSRIESARAQGLTVVVRETAEGLRPNWWDQGDRDQVALPRIELESGRLSFLGSGPIHDALAAYLESPADRDLRVRRLDVVPERTGDGFEVKGVLEPLQGVAVTVGLSRAEDGTLTFQFEVPRSAPVDLSAPAVRAALSPRIRAWLDANAIQGPLCARGQMKLPAGAEEVAVDPMKDLHVEVQLLGMEFEPEVFPCPLEGLRGTLTLSGRNLEIEDLEGWHRDQRVQMEGVIEDLPGEHRVKVRSEARSARVTEDLREALRLEPAGREFLDALQPAGRFDAVTRLEASEVTAGQKQAPPKLWHDVDLLDAEVCFHGFYSPEHGRRLGFPLPLRHVRGQVRASPSSLEFDELVGQAPSGALLTCEGHLRWSGEETRPSGEIRARALDLPLDQDFVDACAGLLGDEVRETFTRLGLHGTADFLVVVRADHGIDAKNVRVELRPKRLHFRHERFPLPLLLHSGRIVLDQDRLVLENVGAEIDEGDDAGDSEDRRRTSTSEPSALIARGWVGVGAAAGTLDLDVDGHRLPLTERSQRALSAFTEGSSDLLWKKLEPSGFADVFFRWNVPDLDSEGRCEIVVEPREASLRPAGLGFTVRDLEGRCTATRNSDGGWTLLSPRRGGLQANAFGGEVSLIGEVSLGLADPGQIKGSLSITGERWRISPRLSDGGEATLLEVARATLPRVEILDSLAPDGWLRFQAEIECEPGRDPRLARLAVGPDRPPNLGRSTLAAANGLKLKVPSLVGKVEWRDGLLQGDLDTGVWSFDRIEAQVSEADLQLRDGRVEWRPGGVEVGFRGYLGSVPFRRLIEPLYGDDRVRRVADLNLEGTTHTTLEDVRLFLPTAAESPSVLKVDAAVDLSRCGMRSGSALQGLDGLLRVHVSYSAEDDLERPSMQITGQLENASVELGGVLVTGVSARLVLAEDVLEILDIGGEYSGGRLRAAENRFTLPLTGDEPYRGTVLLDGMELSRLLEAKEGAPSDLAGRLDVELALRGRGSRLADVEASAAIHLRDGQLWSVPVMDKLYLYGISQLLGQSEPPRFEEGRVDLQLRRGVLHVPRVWLSGPALDIEGSGVLGPERLDFHFYPEVQVDLPLIDLPIIGTIAGWLFSKIERKALSFRFEGPYSDPRVQWDPVRRRPSYEGIADLDRPRLAVPPPLTRKERF